MPEVQRTLVLGAGNPIVGDDGIGIAALERLREGWRFDDAVDLVDGGTWGMNLLPLIDDTDRLLILDAVHAGREPGTLLELERAELPRFLSLKLSPHQIDLREVLALCELRGTLPDDTVVIGLQPGKLDMSTELSPAVASAIESLVQRALVRLRAWGHEASPVAEVLRA